MTKVSMRLFKSALVAAGLTFLCGCSTQIIKTNSDKFPGLHPKFSPGKRTDVVIVHGMCSKSNKWFESHVNILSNKIVPIAPVRIIEGDALDGVQINRTKIESSLGILNLYGIVYSRANEASKRKLIEAKVPGKRAWTSKKIKAFALNDCLADVVAYRGSSGTKIRARVRQVLSDIQKERQNDGRETDRIVLISESLGSKIVRDSLLCDPDESAKKGISLLSNGDVFFMYANQVPFLDLWNDDHCDLPETNSTLISLGITQENSTGNFSDILRLFKEQSVSELTQANLDTPRHWVAFSDPNDILSYQLDINGYSDLNVTNVSLNNTTNWFGVYANPLKAHNGYRSNPRVQEMVLFGCLIKGNKCVVFSN